MRTRERFCFIDSIQLLWKASSPTGIRSIWMLFFLITVGIQSNDRIIMKDDWIHHFQVECFNFKNQSIFSWGKKAKNDVFSLKKSEKRFFLQKKRAHTQVSNSAKHWSIVLLLIEFGIEWRWQQGNVCYRFHWIGLNWIYHYCTMAKFRLTYTQTAFATLAMKRVYINLVMFAQSVDIIIIGGFGRYWSQVFEPSVSCNMILTWYFTVFLAALSLSLRLSVQPTSHCMHKIQLLDPATHEYHCVLCHLQNKPKKQTYVKVLCACLSLCVSVCLFRLDLVTFVFHQVNKSINRIGNIFLW